MILKKQKKIFSHISSIVLLFHYLLLSDMPLWLYDIIQKIFNSVSWVERGVYWTHVIWCRVMCLLFIVYLTNSLSENVFFFFILWYRLVMRNVLMRRPIPYILLRVHIFYRLYGITVLQTHILFQRTGKNDDEIIKLMIKRFIIFII